MKESASVGVTIRKMEESDVAECLEIKYQYFGHFWGDPNDPSTKQTHDNYSKRKLDLSVSLIAELDGKIVGGYFLKKTKLPVYPGNFYDFTGDDTGVEGVSLFVHPDHKGKGVGHMLKHYYKENRRPDIKFIWGQAFHGLKNMGDWLKTRKLFNDMNGVYFTIEMYDESDWAKYPRTPYLDIYEETGSSAADHIEEMSKSGKTTEEMSEYLMDKAKISREEAAYFLSMIL